MTRSNQCTSAAPAALVALLTLAALQAFPQQAPQTDRVVPTLVNYGGVLADENGKPLNHAIAVTFALYAGEQGGDALWYETQQVQPDAQGRYAILLGAMSDEGLPAGLFAAGEARWLGVQAEGETEMPRIRLLSVPYALKAGDAQTLGGLPASAFLQAAPKSTDGTAKKDAVPLTEPAVTGSGTAGYLPMWDSASDITTSALFQSGTAPSAMVGINTANPGQALDIGSGSLIVENGDLMLPQTTSLTSGAITMGGTPFISACCAANTFNTFVGLGAGNYTNPSSDNTAVGYQALTSMNSLATTENTAVGATALTNNLAGSSNTAVGVSSLLVNKYGSSNTAVGTSALQNVDGLYNTALGQGAGSALSSGSSNTFIGQGANAGESTSSLTNATAIGSGAVVAQNNSLVLGASGVNVGINTSTPAYTLDVNGTANFSGLVTFSPSQTFPGGSGSGTITGVTAGAGLTGGGTSGNVTLSLTNTCAKGQVLAWNGSTWACTSPAASPVTGVTAGKGLVSSVSGGVVTLSINPAKTPQLSESNKFTGTQTIDGNLALTGSGNGVRFPDGSVQTTAATGGVPSGFMILGATPAAPPGYTLSGSVVTGNTMTEMAPLITARTQPAVAVMNGTIYALGGHIPPTSKNSPYWTSAMEALDVSTNQWSSLKPMPFEAGGFGAVGDGGYIYVFGGCLLRDRSYDISTETWTELTAFPYPACDFGSAFLPNATPTGGTVYAAGGTTDFGGEYWDNFVASTRYGIWSNAGPPMPTARGYLAMALDPVGNKLYAIGGADLSSSTPNTASILNTVEVFDLVSRKWSTAPSLNVPRSQLGAAYLNGKIYAIGGYNGTSVVNTVEVYDPASNTWTVVPSPLPAKESFGTVVSGGFIYLVGGDAGLVGGRVDILNSVEQYLPPVTLYTYAKD